MSKIAKQIEKLREQEKRLQRETRKVEFLSHILDSAREYEHDSFKDVKADVVSMLEQFVKKQIEAIEAGTEITISVGAPAATVQIAPQQPAVPAQNSPVKSATQAPIEPSPAEKMNFALENRHLGGKKVSVANDRGVSINGQVVGLDAPWVLVKTDTGPVIKVPLENVSLQ